MFKKSGILILLTCLCLAGCGTVDGAGRDIQHVGESIQDSTK